MLCYVMLCYVMLCYRPRCFTTRPTHNETPQESVNPPYRDATDAPVATADECRSFASWTFALRPNPIPVKW